MPDRLEVPSPARNVRIDAQPGSVRLYLDEVDVSEHVLAYRLEHDVHGALPLLILHTRTPSGAIFQGLAKVAIGVEQDPRQTVAEFLATVDPDELDRAALHRTDLGSGRGAVARAMLATLAEWAQGVPPTGGEE